MTADDPLTDPGLAGVLGIAGPVAVPLDNLLRNRSDQVRSAALAVLAALGGVSLVAGVAVLPQVAVVVAVAMRWQPDIEDVAL